MSGRVNEPSSKDTLTFDDGPGPRAAEQTHTHTPLTGRSSGGAHLADADTFAELTQIDAVIASFVPANRFMFRAPLGDFDDVSATAINASATKKYIGPINWDTGNASGGKPDPCPPSPQQNNAK